MASHLFVGMTGSAKIPDLFPQELIADIRSVRVMAPVASAVIHRLMSVVLAVEFLFEFFVAGETSLRNRIRIEIF